MPRRPQDSKEAARIAARIGKRVCALRKERGWTQANVSERVGLTTETYSRLERGLSAPSFPTLMRLCVVLATTPDRIMMPSEPEQNDINAVATARVHQLVTELQDLGPDVLLSVEGFVHPRPPDPPGPPA